MLTSQHAFILLTFGVRVHRFLHWLKLYFSSGLKQQSDGPKTRIQQFNEMQKRKYKLHFSSSRCFTKVFHDEPLDSSSSVALSEAESLLTQLNPATIRHRSRDDKSKGRQRKETSSIVSPQHWACVAGEARMRWSTAHVSSDKFPQTRRDGRRREAHLEAFKVHQRDVLITGT